ncbi:MAG TPA: hypothetical protein VIM99_05125, partial [Blastocatellia bacterium]
MFLRILVVLIWIFTLLQPASAQTWRRGEPIPPQATAKGADNAPNSGSTSDSAGEDSLANAALRRTEIHGWVWVSRTIDMAKHLGGVDNLMTLDGEPLPSMRKPSVT